PPEFPKITPILAGTEPGATSEEGVTSAPVAPTAAPTDSPPTPEGVATHTVQPGDTLLGIAREYGVPMAAIQLQNDLGESTTVQAGQTLSIPAEEGWEGSSAFWVLHVVKPGESLLSIARAYDAEPERMQAVNGLDDADQIGVGQTLILPLTGPAATRTPVPTDTPVPTPTPTASPTLTATASVTMSVPVSPTVSATITSTVSPEPGASATPASESAAPPASLAAWPGEIARLINEVRAEHDMDGLAYNTILEKAAQAHANDCAQRGWCSHTGSDGSDIKARVARAGYAGSGWAECWAQTQSPQRAVEVWMDETPPNDPHRRTLLSDWLTEIGIGVSEADWGTYIIADFGRP
ncbi:MAG: LysM peptidoglycan-binding domain-containing protein, partial [Anaerolineae bacterium]